MRISTKTGALCLVLLVSGTMQAAAAPKKCPAGKQSVPRWGCVPTREVAKAKRICAKLTPPVKDFRQCLCQDGSTIGACGD